ncbi:hypothetical protein L6R49_01545 [Myxococcota bacterium]|nr:hypothetical protein [Myxococcota bacterium]
MSLFALLLSFTLSGAARAEEPPPELPLRVEYKPLRGELVLDGVPIDADRHQKRELVDALMRECEGSAPIQRRRDARRKVGAAMAFGGAGSILVAGIFFSTGGAGYVAAGSVTLAGVGVILTTVPTGRVVRVYNTCRAASLGLTP